MRTLVLLRHGESTWNKANLFTGWTDVELTEAGIEEARQAGRLLKEEGMPPDVLPASECLKDVVDRMLPYWHDTIVPDLQAGHAVLVSAHGNSLRALVKHLDGISDEEIPSVNIPTGFPRVYRLADDDPCQP